MFFEWNELTIAWLLAASEYTGYDRNMAELLRKYIAEGETVCDVGCGMALCDLFLAPYAKKITCVDIDPAVIDFVRRRAAQQRLFNVEALCADGNELTGQWDTVMALFHGMPEVIPDYLRLAEQRLIFVVRSELLGTTGPAGYQVGKCCDISTTTVWLEKAGFRFTLERFTLEFGQPHRDLEDAVAYTRCFSHSAPEDVLMASVAEKVRPTGREDYPLYTPKAREFGIFVLDRDANGRLL